MKNNRGSALVMVILIMMVVMVLGSTVMSISLISYKMKKTNTTAQANLYLSEAGLDEAVAVTKKTSNLAIKEGNQEVETFYSSFDFEAEVEDEDSPFILDGKLNDEYLEVYANNIFQGKYKEYIVNNLIDNIEGNTYTTLNGKVEEYRVEPVNENILYFFDNKATVNIESEVVDRGVKRRITGDIIVNVPNFSQPYKEERIAVLVYEIPLFNQALAADGDVYLGGKVNIKGSVYAQGVDKGVMIEDEGSEVNITGNIYTKLYTRLNNSDTTLNCGNIYVNSVDISADSSYIYADSIITMENISSTENISADSIKVDVDEALDYINKMGEVDFPAGSFTVDNQYDATNNKNTEEGAYIFLSTNSNEKNIYLLGEEFSDYEVDESRDVVLYLEPEKKYKGIIVSKGNVYIKGSVDFEGIIISYNDIDLDGIGTKNIKNSKRVIYKMIEEDKIKTEFITDNALPKGIIQSIKRSVVTPSGVQVENNIELINWNIEY